MRNLNSVSHYFYRVSSVLVVALIITLFSAASLAGVGTVQFSIGNVTATNADGVLRALLKGADINNGDTIQTAEGRTQIKFADGGYMSFQPNTEFKVEDYYFSGQADGTEKGFFRLVKGGLRAITGLIGKKHKPAWKLNTPVATIGIRGTETLNEFKDGKLKVQVGDGAAYIENQFGNLILYKGQTGEVVENLAPQYSNESLTISAAGPNGGNPEKNQKQQQSEQANSAIYSTSDIRNDKGLPSVFAGGNNVTDQNASNYPALFQSGLLTLAYLPVLNTLGLKANYSATINAFNIEGNTADLTSELQINFATYTADFNVQTNNFVGPNLAGKHLVGSANGLTLNPTNGVIASCGNCGVLNTYDGVAIVGTGALNVAAAHLNPADISQVTMSYTVHEAITGEHTNIHNQVLTGGNLTQ